MHASRIKRTRKYCIYARLSVFNKIILHKLEKLKQKKERYILDVVHQQNISIRKGSNQFKIQMIIKVINAQFYLHYYLIS